ncbi:hypothetical protein [Alkalicoccus urumqiensis]|uniref:GerMN domain-containing protein n=1 Tax=Alkalicoccus urumqiensis TaxID=1548213 RepID=A0A2P6MI00_ALKUR|nr:hypothetical protein [Alkalicoccus urumqiensis]PRO65907.1 hypothetical protein C6I21_06265 [Alkalicoccus urumqiensis]
MTKEKWTEDKIEKTLTDLPKVEDRRSKDELFQTIQAQSGQRRMERRKDKKPWFFPAAASAAAALLLLLMLPSFMNTGLFTSDQPQSNTAGSNQAAVENNAAAPAEEEGTDTESDDGGSMTAMDEADNTEAEEAVVERPENTENEENTAAENDAGGDNAAQNNENMNTAELPEENDAEENAAAEEEVEYTVTEENDIFLIAEASPEEDIVTVTPASASGLDREQAVREALEAGDPTGMDLFAQLEEVVFDSPEEGAVSLRFEEDVMLQSMSSAQQVYTSEVLQEVLSLYRVREVYFFVGDEPADFGQSGEDRMDISSLNRGFYGVPGSDRLISARASGEQQTNGAGEPLNFVETVLEMQDAESGGTESVIPDALEFTGDMYVEGDTAMIFYTYDGGEAEETRFHEAVQLTAKYFTISEIEFYNESTGELTIAPVGNGS